MPRRIFNRLRPLGERVRNSRYVKILGPKIRDPRLWSVNRKAITCAFGTGIALSFIPLPVHLPLALISAMVWHLNVPTIAASLLILNPFTAVPIYYVAYRVGALLLRTPVVKFEFELSWQWLAEGLGHIWKPFLFGCLVCGIGFGLLAYWLLEFAWRWSTVMRMNQRRTGVRD
jgi:uncharacterized protein